MRQEPAVVGPDLVETTTALDVTGPFHSQALLDFLRRRVVSGIEDLQDTIYTRTLRLAHGPATVSIDVADDRVEMICRVADPTDLPSAVTRCRWLVDLDTDSVEVDRHLGGDPALRASVHANPGLRVPGHVDGFEVAVRAVVGQQISVAGARTILGRLVADYGSDFDGAVGLTRLFPTPESLAGAHPERLPMPRARGRALVGLAVAVATGVVVLDRTCDLADVRRSLLALQGIGPWTADYIALRALGDPDVFMGTDLGVRQGLALMGLGAVGADVTDRWRPWRSYALMHVWKSLDQEVT
jgi:AraC family transcriptional regulator, regulatory protein of adaptative response / DNA-3-methyladenine glycosylase II